MSSVIMDITVRIIPVIIGVILTHPGYVQAQVAGIAVGFGGGDFMMDTPLGEMPPTIFDMGGTASNAGTANQQTNPGLGGTVGRTIGEAHGGIAQGNTGGGLDPSMLMNLFGTPSPPILYPNAFTTSIFNSPLVILPDSVGISDQQTFSAPASNSVGNQRSKEPDYVLQNEAFTALGNVGHLIKVPVLSPINTPKAGAVTNPINMGTVIAQSNALNVGKGIQLSSQSNTLTDHSVTIGTDANGLSITGEPVAMFNPGTGLASEMSVLQSSLSGNRVDMSGFVPPPFTSKRPPSVSKSGTTFTSGTQDTLLVDSVSSNTKSSKQTESTYTIGKGLTSAADQHTVSDTNVKSSSKINIAVSNSLLESHSKGSVTFDDALSGSVKSDQATPHIQDLVTDGIYPFEGNAAARDTTLDKKLKVVSDLENAIRNTERQSLHLEPHSLSSNLLSTSLSDLKGDSLTQASYNKPSFDTDIYKSTQGIQNTNDLAFAQFDKSSPSTLDKTSNLQRSSADILAQESAQLPWTSRVDGRKKAKLSTAALVTKPITAKLSFDIPQSVSPTTEPSLPKVKTAQLRIDPVETFSNRENQFLNTGGRINVDNSQPISRNPVEPVIDKSSFPSNKQNQITLNDPNYITLMGNVVGVVESKDLSHTGRSASGNIVSPDALPIGTELNLGAGTGFDVLSGSNGAPITNMAGIRIPNVGASSLNQEVFNANSLINNLVNRQSHLDNPTFTLNRKAAPNNNDPVPSGSFIIGAGQPNAKVIKSTFGPGNNSPLGIDSGKAIAASETKIPGTIRDLSSTGESFKDVNAKPTTDHQSKIQQPQGFAVDMSAFAQPTFEIPSINIGSFNPGDLSMKPSFNQNAQTDKIVKDAPLSPSQSQTVPTAPAPTYVGLNSQNTLTMKPPKDITQGVVYDTISTPSPLSQEIVNVQSGWSNDKIPTFDLSARAKNSVSHLTSSIGNTQNIATIPRQQINSQNTKFMHNQGKPMIGTIFGDSNVQSPSTSSRNPSMDFMTSFLNNPSLKTNPNIAMVPNTNSAQPSMTDRSDQAVNQFGVAEIYTRKPQLNQSQWSNLLSSLSSQAVKMPSNKHTEYLTRGAAAPSNTIPVRKNSFQSPSATGILRNKLSQKTSIRTMFEAPGVSMLNSGGFTNINSALGVPERKEFVEIKTARNPNPQRQGGTLRMPMFQQLGIQKNLVSAPNSGSTRDFAFTSQNNAPRASLTDPQNSRSFTIGKSVVVGNEIPERTQSSQTGMALPMDSFNMNQPGSTGLRLGQPTVFSNLPQDNMQSVVPSNLSPQSNRDPAMAKFSSGRSAVVFGSGGTGDGRTLGTKTAVTSSVQSTVGTQATSKCNYMADPTSPIHFILQLRNFRHRFRCALGTAFDMETCECSTRIATTADCLEVHMDFNNGKIEDSSVNRLPIGNENVEVTNRSTPLTGIALFGDNSKLTIWRYQNFDFRDDVMLKVQFRPGPGGGRLQPLISNCDGTGGGPSIGIIYDSQLQEVLLFLRTDNDTVKELQFKVNPNEWNDVTYIYDGQEFIGIVNGVRRYVSRQDPHLLGIIGGEIKSLPAQGLIEIRDAALVLGYCSRYGHFHGAMVDIQVYTCIPRDFRLE